MITVVLMTSAVFLSGCSLGTPDRETELKDTLSTTYSELNSTFSGQTGKYPLVAEYLGSWAKSNNLTVKENAEHYMVCLLYTSSLATSVFRLFNAGLALTFILSCKDISSHLLY